MLNPYGTSKCWVFSFTMSLAKEYRDSGVGIYLFQNGLVKSDRMGHMVFIDGFEDQLLKVFRVVACLFAKAGAVVAESGGILSHSSIIAREKISRPASRLLALYSVPTWHK